MLYEISLNCVMLVFTSQNDKCISEERVNLYTLSDVYIHRNNIKLIFCLTEVNIYRKNDKLLKILCMVVTMFNLGSIR